MPGRAGVRPDLGVTVDLKNRWGWVIKSSSNPQRHRHIAYNVIKWPELMEEREKDGVGLSDLDTLLERNVEDNLIELQGGLGKHFKGEFPDWKDLWGTKSGTLVIASCGPSLTQSLHTLYRRRGEFDLMCLNRSMRAFQQADVLPDYYYFVERRGLQDWVHDVLEGGIRPFALGDVTLIATPPADPRIVRAFDPRNRYFGWTSLGNQGHNPSVAKLSSFDCKASTTAANAPYIAWKLGYSTVVLVGCDFALDCGLFASSDGKNAVVQPTRVYFDKALSDIPEPRCPQWLKAAALPERGHDGKMMMVTGDCQGYADYLQAILDICQNEGGMECINASPRGILRWNNMELDAALDRAAERGGDGEASKTGQSAVEA